MSKIQKQLLGEGNNAEKLVFSSLGAPICIPCVALTPKPNWLQQCIYEQPLNPGSNFLSVPDFIWIVLLQYKYKLDFASTHMVVLVKMCFWPVEPVQLGAKPCLCLRGMQLRELSDPQNGGWCCKSQNSKFRFLLPLKRRTSLQKEIWGLCNVQCAMCNVQWQGRHIMLKPSSGLKWEQQLQIRLRSAILWSGLD